MGLDEAIAKGELDPTKVLKKRRHDDTDQDPPTDSEKEKKKRKRKDTQPSKKHTTSTDSSKGKTPAKSSKTDKSVITEEVVNNIELEYNLEQCYLALTDQFDWANPEGDRCSLDLSKPLPLQGPPGHLTIPVDYFFNNDLEYLKTRNKERKYVISLTKIKAARYELEGIKEMIPRSRNAATSCHEVYSQMNILSVIRISVDKQFGYGYLKEMVVRRADQNEYAFKEADFSRLHLNDIEDMFLLYVQHKLHNLTSDEIVDLVNALHTFTRSIVIKKRVKDVQLGVESYQTKLNITHPKTSYADFPNKEPYKNPEVSSTRTKATKRY
ncbi:hypothetical protein Tco_0034004 [Tanacetum coccineum]